MAPDPQTSTPFRARRLVVAGLVAAVVAAGIAVPLALRGGDDREGRPAAKAAGVIGVTGVTGVAAHPDQSPPRQLIAAGSVAVSTYYTTKLVKRPDGNAVGTYEWWLLDTATGRYAKTDWAWVDVAPGMRTAAVLERDLPVERIGLVDLATGKVRRWIDVGGGADGGVGGVRFSPDGKRLLATAYRLNPDGLFKDASYELNDRTVPGPKQSRAGFYVIDVASGKAAFAERPAGKTEPGVPVGGRQDFQWSRDGKRVWAPADNKSGRVFYDGTGKEVPAPEQEADPYDPGVARSPDGKLETGAFVGEGDEIVSEVRRVKDGERAAVVPGQQLLAWADDRHLIAWRCDPERCDPGKGEFRNQLLLVGLDGSTAPLSGFRSQTLRDDSRWTPVFTRR